MYYYKSTRPADPWNLSNRRDWSKAELQSTPSYRIGFASAANPPGSPPPQPMPPPRPEDVPPRPGGVPEEPMGPMPSPPHSPAPEQPPPPMWG